MGQEEVIYWLDASDRIQAVNASWDAFARENDGEAILEDRVLGKPIRQFISGDPTKMWLDTLVAYARISEEKITREYRCDSPDTKRFMEMSVAPEADKQVRLTHRILKVEAMEPPVAFETAPESASDAALNPAPNQIQFLCFRCSICNRVQVQGQWQEGDAAARAGHLDPSPRVIYRVSESCRDKISEYRDLRSS